MMAVSQPKALKWNQTQVDIFNYLNNGMQPAEIASQLKVSKSTVTKVANAKAKNQSPSTPYIPHPAKNKKHIVPDSPSSVPKGAEGLIDPKQQQQKPVQGANPGNAGTGDLKIPNTDTSLLLLKPVPQTCALTPIMINARYTAIKEMGWPEDVTWEDFFDTVLVYCFKYWGFGLQGVYKLDKKGDSPQSSQSSQSAKGNGHKEDAALKETATKVGLAVMALIQAAEKETANAGKADSP